MSKTPIIPSWIKDFRAEGFTNIWELIPDEKHLYGTETLYGDWNAELLILLQDFSTAGTIRCRIDQNDSYPYRHDPLIPTNRQLIRCADSLRTGPTPQDCGLLYGSALVGLLKHGDDLSASFKRSPLLHAYTKKVLRWTVEHMPKLRAIACCGKEAWTTATSALIGHTPDWRTQMSLQVPLLSINGSISLYALRHRGLSFDEWAVMAKHFQNVGIPATNSPRRIEPIQKPTTELEDGMTEPVVSASRFPSKFEPPVELLTWLPADFVTPSGVDARVLRRESTDGKDVFLCTLAKMGGATLTEVWVALRERAEKGWDSASKVQGGFSVIKSEGWGWWVDRKTGRIYARRTASELAQVRAKHENST